MTERKIEKLTPAQAEELVRFRRKWYEVGISTARADRPKAEAAITAMYARIGQPRPVFIWCESPATSLLAVQLLKSGRFKGWCGNLPVKRDSLRDLLRTSLRTSLQDSLWNSLWDSLGASLRDSLWDSLGASLWNSLRTSLWNSLGASLWDSLGASLRDSLWDSLWDSLRTSLWDSLRTSLWDSLRTSLGDSLPEAWWGQHEAHWISLYLFCRDVVGVRYAEEKSADLDLWRDLAESCCWWWPYGGYCVASERPTVVNMERWRDAERLHAEFGPALAFADGWQVHALHGVRVPAWLAESHPDDLDARKILAVENVDQRREGIRRMGGERLVEQLDPATLDTRGDYSLLAVEMGVGEPWHYLKMKNPSLADTWHVEAVPRECRTVQHALNWRRYRDVNKQWKPSQLT